MKTGSSAHVCSAGREDDEWEEGGGMRGEGVGRKTGGGRNPR